MHDIRCTHLVDEPMRVNLFIYSKYSISCIFAVHLFHAGAHQHVIIEINANICMKMKIGFYFIY